MGTLIVYVLTSMAIAIEVKNPMKESTKCAIALRGAVLKVIAVVGTTAFVALVASSAHAVDHNNIDANSPLSFDDAESIGLGEQSLEVGAALIAVAKAVRTNRQ
jgi:hypothetical protein